MSYLPILFREDNFPQIKFKKIATNRNKRFYRLLRVIKDAFAWLTRKPQATETRTNVIKGEYND